MVIESKFIVGSTHNPRLLVAAMPCTCDNLAITSFWCRCWRTCSFQYQGPIRIL